MVLFGIRVCCSRTVILSLCGLNALELCHVRGRTWFIVIADVFPLERRNMGNESLFSVIVDYPIGRPQNVRVPLIVNTLYKSPEAMMS